MILGFLGKGGSGKSSVATQVALWLHAHKHIQVLAIDADHNMDLAYNLCAGEVPQDVPYFGSRLSDITRYVGVPEGQKYDTAFLSDTKARFQLGPIDDITLQLSVVNEIGMRMMVAGPQTDTVLFGQSCSHSLTTPLKVFLPLLKLSEDQYVVVDEKAGADGVSTGIVTGIDVGVIVCEPALHSIKAAKQIADLMDFYETPYLFVANKVQSDEDVSFITETLGQEPVCFLFESTSIKRDPGAQELAWSDTIATLIKRAKDVHMNNRLARTVQKFKRNRAFEDK